MSGKGKFQPDNRNGCEKYIDSDDDEWFLGFGKKRMRCTCKVLIEPIEDRYTKTDNKVVHVEREEQRDPEVEMMVRRSWTKEVHKMVMRCSNQKRIPKMNDCYLERYRKF